VPRWGLCRSGCDIEACGYRRSPGAGAAGVGPADWDWPPGGCRGCAARGVTSRPAGTGDHLGPGPVGWALPIGIGHRVTGMSRRAGAGRGATSRTAGTGDHLGPGPVGWALPIGIGHRATGMSRRAGAGAVPVGVRHRGLRAVGV